MIEKNRLAYGSLAALVYDIDKPVGRSFGDIEFYADRLKAGGARQVLEPAAGNGRVLIPLAEAGFAMTGFDNSPEMLAYLERNCDMHGISACIANAGFADFAFDGRFDAIILPAGSFQLIYDFDAAASFLQRCRSHLSEGGLFIFDLDPASEFRDHGPGERSWQTGDGSLIRLTEAVRRFDRNAQQVEYDNRYEQWRDGQVVSAQSELFRLRWWRPEQIVPLLKDSGFGEVVASGSYQWRRDSHDGETITLTAIAA